MKIKRVTQWAMLAASCGLLMACQQTKKEPAPKGKPVAALEKVGLPAGSPGASFPVGDFQVVQDAPSTFRVLNGARDDVMRFRTFSGAKKNVLAGDVALSRDGNPAVPNANAITIGNGMARILGLNNAEVALRGGDFKTADGNIIATYGTPGTEGYLYFNDPFIPGVLMAKDGTVFTKPGVVVDPKAVERLRIAKDEALGRKPVAVLERAQQQTQLVVNNFTVVPAGTGYDVSDKAGTHVAFLKTYTAGDPGIGVVAADVQRNNTGKALVSDQDIVPIAREIGKVAGLTKLDIVRKDALAGQYDTYRNLADGKDYLGSAGVLTDGTRVFTTPGVTVDFKAAKDLQAAYDPAMGGKNRPLSKHGQ